MIAFSSCKSFTVSLGLVVGLLMAAPRAKGDAMALWAGATAKAGHYSQSVVTATYGDYSQSGATASYVSNSKSGATATEKDSWSNYVPFTFYGHQFAAPSQGNSSASAGGSFSSLLQVDTMSRIGDPGRTEQYGVDGGSANAEADWGGDSVHLTPPSSGSLPDAVRLQFSLIFSPLWNGSNPHNGTTVNGGVTVVANHTTFFVSPYTYGSLGPDEGKFGSITDGTNGNKVGTFHLDLPVDSTGTSAAFWLRLIAESTAHASSTTPGYAEMHDVLALTGVTRTDGSSLDGYGISFASGLSLGGEQPVPEPSTVALWSAVVIGGAWLRRRS